MADLPTEQVCAFSADVVDVCAALHGGEPAIVFKFGYGDYRMPGIVLHRRGFAGLDERVRAAILEALANDGLAT